jgi:hypothetical protein
MQRRYGDLVHKSYELEAVRRHRFLLHLRHDKQHN